MLELVLLSVRQLCSWEFGSLLVALLCGFQILKKPNRANVPLVDSIPGQVADTKPSLLDLLKHGYENYKHQVFKLRVPHGEQVVIPMSMIDSLKALPESQISLQDSLKGQFMGDYTMIGKHSESMMASIRGDLQRHMSEVVLSLSDEVEPAFQDEISARGDWESVKIYHQMLRIVARLSGRAFVGLPASRSEDFINATCMYTMDSFTAGFKIASYPKIFQPLVAFFCAEMRKVKAHLDTVTRIMAPLVRARSGAANPLAISDDMISWNMKNSPQGKSHDLAYQGLQQLQLSFAAIHTTAALLTNIVFDLAARPSDVEELRAELDSVLAPEDGVLTKASLSKLRRMDSFMTECQRHNPAGNMTFNRRTTSGFSLPDGTWLPKGTFLAAASSLISMDPKIWPEPEKFDGFRFERMRRLPQNEHKFQFVSTGPEMLLFGHGTHACPGRFFVANEIKIVMAHLITKYDLSFAQGTGRPESLSFDLAFMPNPMAEVRMRLRQSQ